MVTRQSDPITNMAESVWHSPTIASDFIDCLVGLSSSWRSCVDGPTRTMQHCGPRLDTTHIFSRWPWSPSASERCDHGKRAFRDHLPPYQFHIGIRRTVMRHLIHRACQGRSDLGGKHRVPATLIVSATLQVRSQQCTYTRCRNHQGDRYPVWGILSETPGSALKRR